MLFIHYGAESRALFGVGRVIGMDLSANKRFRKMLYYFQI